MRLTWVAALMLVAAPACTGHAERGAAPAVTAPTSPTTVAPSSATTLAPPASTVPSVPATASTVTAPVVIDYRIERRSADPATADFEATVVRTLGDARGWQRAGFAFLRGGSDARFSVILAEPDEAEALCRPYDVFRKYSCQNGPIVVINAERWRHATPEWTGDLSTYRAMLVNHEVGHLLGMHHPKQQCPRPGVAAPVMAQQSTELNGCLPNPWPLADEVAIAARHDLPLAPPFER